VSIPLTNSSLVAVRRRAYRAANTETGVVR
jgi:hypothetical protein